jgi:hypothetical protein
MALSCTLKMATELHVDLAGVMVVVNITLVSALPLMSTSLQYTEMTFG